MPASVDNTIYDRIPATWWDEDGFMAVLRTSVNPPRFGYFRDLLLRRLALDPGRLALLDVGCGGGLLAEQFAALGCEVTGVDLSVPTLAAAREHAARSGLEIRYLQAGGESLPFEPAKFDVVCCCDVLEHVDNVDAVVAEIARVLKPGGVFLFDTINRTLRSRLVAIKIVQDWPLTRFVPRNVHVWEKFIRPGELAASLERHGVPAGEFTGLAPVNPLAAIVGVLRKKIGAIDFTQLGANLLLRRSRDMSISYMGYAVRALQA